MVRETRVQSQIESYSYTYHLSAHIFFTEIFLGGRLNKKRTEKSIHFTKEGCAYYQLCSERGTLLIRNTIQNIYELNVYSMGIFMHKSKVSDVSQG